MTELAPWELMVAAENAYFATRRQLFAAGAESQLRLALGSVQGRGAALRALRDAPIELVYDLMDPLFEVATLTTSEVGLARDVIGRADPGWLVPRLRPLIDAFLTRGDLDYADYRRLAELLDALRQPTLLEVVVGAARASDDEDIREVGDDFADRRYLSLDG